MYNVDILVNGSRCKQYNHNGKIFIEAKKGSEYTIEIKNESWTRILAVCSVDGLDILNGKKANENGNGYVINQLGNAKFDGFRVSDDKVAKFVFDYKDSSYAKSKDNGSEKNVGVIGIRLFSEKVKPLPEIKEVHHHWPQRPYYGWPNTGTPSYPYPTIWCDATFNAGMNDATYGSVVSDSNTKGGKRGQVQGMLRGMNMMSNAAPNTQKLSSEIPRGFDMGTKWGEAKESRVIEVDFEKGILAFSKDIYYASRESLIQMGVPIGNEKQVSFPEPFSDKYATPPEGWIA